MNDIIQDIRLRASKKKNHIVLAEGGDPRVQQAERFLVRKNICDITVLHSGEIEKASPFSPLNYAKDLPNIESYTQSLWQKRSHKLNSIEEAKAVVKKPLYYAASMVAEGQADGCVAGSVATSAEVIRAAVQVLGMKAGTSVVSSIFLMALPEGNVLTYADCGVVPYPCEQQLADIALTSAQTHEKLTGQIPKVAMLSFSTKGSAPHPRSQLVIDALEIARNKNPTLIIDGELQFDAAFVPTVAKRKAPDSKLKGRANVFIFPNLDAGNIAYKITERLAGASATGPILQGLAKPMMDLSRGCSWQDIVNAACVAILMKD